MTNELSLGEKAAAIAEMLSTEKLKKLAQSGFFSSVPIGIDTYLVALRKGLEIHIKQADIGNPLEKQLGLIVLNKIQASPGMPSTSFFMGKSNGDTLPDSAMSRLSLQKDQKDVLPKFLNDLYQLLLQEPTLDEKTT